MKTKFNWQDIVYSELLSLERENNEIKFDLFVQSRKVQQISQTLAQYMLKPQTVDVNWLSRNQALVNQLMDNLLDDSMFVLDGAQLDKESIDLSMSLMTGIRKTVGLVRKVVAEVEDNN